jgi:hypothetical protein
MSSAQFTGKQWIEASHFHPMTESEVLAEVSRRVSEERKQGFPHPLVLLDLDSTLYEVGPRTFQILKEWIAAKQSAAFGKVRDRLSSLQLEHVGYSLNDTFTSVGLSTADREVHDAIRDAKEFWRNRFFTSEYLRYDRAYAGAAEFSRKLHELGSELVYLTGRDEPGMGEGTRANLIRDGFPWNRDRTHLILKPSFELPDLEHKRGAAKFIQQRGPLIASFENEPANLAALYEIFPQAMHVFVDTVCSDHPANACHGLYRIRNFPL